jgi:hypothetical protein
VSFDSNLFLLTFFPTFERRKGKYAKKISTATLITLAKLVETDLIS